MTALSPVVSEILEKLHPKEVRRLLTWLNQPKLLNEYERQQDTLFAKELYSTNHTTPQVIQRLMARSDISRATAYRIVVEVLSH